MIRTLIAKVVIYCISLEHITRGTQGKDGIPAARMDLEISLSFLHIWVGNLAAMLLHFNFAGQETNAKIKMAEKSEGNHHLKTKCDLEEVKGLGSWVVRDYIY